jgi:CRISPR associated protein Cas1/Domain of unknown function DUF83
VDYKLGSITCRVVRDLPESTEMSTTEEAPELLPARMINELVYCPRLFWLEHVEREFAESYDTVDGERVHRRVDQASGELPNDITKMRSDAASVDLSSERLGLVAKINLVRSEDGNAIPIDFKRGKQSSVPGGVNDPERVQVFFRAFVLGKVKNQRTMIRRSRGDAAKRTLQEMSLLLHRIEKARGTDELLGFEGTAAQRYFDTFGEMLNVGTGFEITGRNRRPPTDPVNAMLSFGYAMLSKEVVAAAIAVGFEPGLGIYHKIRPGRPSLALDLMEEFRPLIVDSTVLTTINSKEMRPAHFDRRGKAIVLTADGRRVFIGAFERRLRSTIRHPLFGYEVTY